MQTYITLSAFSNLARKTRAKRQKQKKKPLGKKKLERSGLKQSRLEKTGPEQARLEGAGIEESALKRTGPEGVSSEETERGATTLEETELEQAEAERIMLEEAGSEENASDESEASEQAELEATTLDESELEQDEAGHSELEEAEADHPELEQAEAEENGPDEPEVLERAEGSRAELEEVGSEDAGKTALDESGLEASNVEDTGDGEDEAERIVLEEIALEEAYSEESETHEGAGGWLARWSAPLFWGAVVLLLAAAVVLHLYHLDLPFDRDGYDEGVYWQSLRAMLAGNGLYHSIFYSQPPAFLLSTFPVFALFGDTLWSARFAIALVSLLAFPGALLLGKALAGRRGILCALLLLLVNPFFLAESQIIQAEALSVAFTFLAIGFAFLWWQRPDGWRGALLAGFCGVALVLSILCKLLCISTLVPIALLMFARVWQILRKQPNTSSRSWLPILTGIVCALLTALALVLPFVGSFQDFWAGMVTFHRAAGQALPGTIMGNLHQMKTALFTPLALVAAYGALSALLRKDWRVLPLLFWLLTTLAMLITFHPLFNHHLIVLEPPFIALAVLGIARPAAYKAELATIEWLPLKPERLARWINGLALFLILATALLGLWQDVQYYNATNATQVSDAVLNLWQDLQPPQPATPGNPWQGDLRVASDLRQAITPDQWVITDAQFIAGLADRDTPPALVDTSTVRIKTGYLTLAQLEQIASNPRVHAVLFYTNRFVEQLPTFRAWVARHFHLLHTYGPGLELWVR